MPLKQPAKQIELWDSAQSSISAQVQIHRMPTVTWPRHGGSHGDINLPNLHDNNKLTLSTNTDLCSNQPGAVVQAEKLLESGAREERPTAERPELESGSLQVCGCTSVNLDLSWRKNMHVQLTVNRFFRSGNGVKCKDLGCVSCGGAKPRETPHKVALVTQSQPTGTQIPDQSQTSRQRHTGSRQEETLAPAQALSVNVSDEVLRVAALLLSAICFCHQRWKSRRKVQMKCVRATSIPTELQI
ncbi:unnamed protein product [Pleuronectes platessa]|uniref:Uncharacterized protein n=1 Tax=Pleuronectes platessa TaxID=8262 RepID=A0A9N7YMP5_PLEPL|nr:unnamed protein product [Pleuronectes platessa]